MPIIDFPFLRSFYDFPFLHTLLKLCKFTNVFVMHVYLSFPKIQLLKKKKNKFLCGSRKNKNPMGKGYFIFLLLHYFYSYWLSLIVNTFILREIPIFYEKYIRLI